VLLLAVWTAFGIFFGTQDYVRDAYLGRPASLPGRVISWILCGYSWAILTVPVMRFARRFAVQRLGWARFFAVHIPVAAFFALVQLGIYVVLAMLLPGAKGRGIWEFYQQVAASEFRSSFLIYFLIVSAVLAYDAWMKSREPVEIVSTANSNGHAKTNGNGNGYVRRLPVKENSRIVLVDTDNINWFESYGNYVFIHTDGGRHILRETMTALEKKLDPEQFIRIRRSAIVRADRIVELRQAVNGEFEVSLRCGDTIAATRRYRKNLDSYIRS
jgi:DNA-binding LytR/AlgR family response regulator